MAGGAGRAYPVGMDKRLILRGAAAGAAATFPMTLVMAALHGRLPARQRTPLPPRLITEDLTERAGFSPREVRRPLVWLGHFGYGALCGALASPLLGRAPGPGAGVLFGAAVWAASYFGLVPALGLRPSGPRETPERNGLMLIAHLAFGAALAAALRAAGARHLLKSGS